MSRSDTERGAVLVTVALLLIVLVSFLALAVDVGRGFVERRKVQAVADAAALAGAQVLTDNGSDQDIRDVIEEYVQQRNLPSANETREWTAQWLNGTTPLGDVESVARPAVVTGIRVTVTGHVPTLFATVLGIDTMTATALGAGGYAPLDVVLVVDRSGSMDDDSCLLKGIASPNPIRMATYFHNSNQCASRTDAPYYRIDEPICEECVAHWATSGTNRCRWPDGGVLGSEVNARCGSVQTSSSLCTACRAVWNSSPLQPITDLKTAAKGFVDLVDAELAATSPHIGLVSYSSGNATLDRQLTGTLGSVKSGIDSLSAGGNTNCEDGMYRARLELTTSGRQRWTAVKAIVFMSDGNANECRTSCNATQAKARAIAEAQLAGTKRIVVYTVGLGAYADQDMLQQMVTNGGVYVYAPTGAELADRYRTLFEKIKRLRLVQ